MGDLTSAPPRSRRVPGWRSGLVLLLLAGMVALGVVSSRPKPLPTPDDPQNLVQVFRSDLPCDLLLALPLRPTDQIRVAADVPLGLHPLFVLVDSDGSLHELSPLDRRQNGNLMEFSAPPLRPMPLPESVGTKVILVCAAPEAPPTLAAVQEALPFGPWPELPQHTLIRFARGGVEVTGPKGPRLPEPERTADIEGKLRDLVQKLTDRLPFVVGVAFPVRKPAAGLP